MRTLMLSALAATFFALAPAPAAASDYDQILADARAVRTEAEEVKLLLKHKAAEQVVLQQRLDVIGQHARSLKDAVDRIDTASFTSKQMAALERARVTADTLLVILNNKAAILATPDGLAKQRGLLRAKAEGIVARAATVEKQLQQLRG
ncbi:MAG: hypothetical protein U0P30_14290 [Vicinamibacterales bacterium]